MRQCRRIVRDVADHRQIDRGWRSARQQRASLALTISTSCGHPRPGRQSISRCRFVLLIFFAEGGVGFAAMVAGANTMLLVLRILRRQVAIVAQHSAQGGKPRGGGYMADPATHGIDGQRRGLRKIRDAVAAGSTTA